MYSSIPLLCPPPRWLYRNCTTELSQKIKIVTGVADQGTCIRTVSCGSGISALAYRNNTIAIGLKPKDIAIFDALTGSQRGVFSGHTDVVNSLAFSSDGTLLVSGSEDRTIKLWDVQTGAAIKTLCPHSWEINCVAISADNAVIASGSYIDLIYLWHLKSGNHHVVVRSLVKSIAFCPKNPQHLISSHESMSNCDESTYESDTSQQWNIDGCEIGPALPGHYSAFSPDGTHFAVCNETNVTIRHTDSMMTVVEFSLAESPHLCCFSPDGNMIAMAVGHTIYLWDITSHDPHPIQAFPGHTFRIISLAFSSSLTIISASYDKTIKFWQINASLTNKVALGSESTHLTLAPIMYVSLQVRDGLAFSIDVEGIVKTWDISTGTYKESCKVEADIKYADIQLICGRLIIVFNESLLHAVRIWDAERGELHKLDDTSPFECLGLRILRDEAMVIRIGWDGIRIWSVWTGKSIGEVRLERNEGYHFDPLDMENSKVLVHSGKSLVQGWDFGVPGSTPTQISEKSLDGPHLTLTDDRRWLEHGSVRIEDAVTGKEVFQLCGRYANPSDIRWNGQYLVAGYGSGEVSILDFSPILDQ